MANGLRPERFSPRYWSSQLTLSKNNHSKFFDMGRESIRVYNTMHKLDKVERSMSVWWYLIQTLLPAYFSSTPKSEVNLRKYAGSTLYEMASVQIERNCQFSMDEDFDFSQLGLGAALQLLLTGRAVTWARYDGLVRDKTSRINLLRDADNRLFTADGEYYEGESFEDEDGSYYEEKSEYVERERAILDLVRFDDYLNSDARNESEVEWRARRAFLSKEDATKLFGKDVAKKLDYNAFPESLKNEKSSVKDLHEGKAEMWEIYSELAGKVFWCQEDGDNTILESGTPPIKFDNFYPCTVINASVDPDSTIPTSDYAHVRDQILQIERMTTRMEWMISAIRANGAYDATMQDTIEQILTGDNKLYPVGNWPSTRNRGGLNSALEFLNIDPYVNALTVLSSQRQEALNMLYETMKASDLLRGVSDPTKTATANRLENQWSSLGLIVRQNQFAEFIGESVAKLGTVICEKFSPETILDRGDADNFIRPLVQQPQDEQQASDPMFIEAQVQQYKEAIVGIIKDSKERCYRISIKSDSMVALDQRQERQDAVDLLQSIGGFFDQLKTQIEAYPSTVEMAIELIKFTSRRYRGGKELEPLFVKAIQDVAQANAVKAEQAANMPPDPKMLEVQARVQIAQTDSQTKLQLAQVEMQSKQLDAQIEANKAQASIYETDRRYSFDILKEQNEFGLKQWVAQQDVALKQNAQQIELLKVQATAAADAANVEIQREIQAVRAMLENKKIETNAVVETNYLQQDAANRAIDNQRQRERLDLDWEKHEENLKKSKRSNQSDKTE